MMSRDPFQPKKFCDSAFLHFYKTKILAIISGEKTTTSSYYAKSDDCPN